LNQGTYEMLEEIREWVHLKPKMDTEIFSNISWTICRISLAMLIDTYIAIGGFLVSFEALPHGLVIVQNRKLSEQILRQILSVWTLSVCAMFGIIDSVQATKHVWWLNVHCIAPPKALFIFAQ